MKGNGGHKKKLQETCKWIEVIRIYQLMHKIFELSPEIKKNGF